MTAQPLPRWFRLLFIAVMLTLCAVIVFQVFHQAGLRAQIASLEGELTTVQQRLEKQQREYDDIAAELPVVQAQLAEVKPLADAAYAREQDLREQRRALRAENEDLEAQLSHLQPEMDAAAAAMLNTQMAVGYLEEALVFVDLALP